MRADIGLLEAHESLVHTERRIAIDVRARAGGGERHLEQEGAQQRDHLKDGKQGRLLESGTCTSI